MAKNDHHITVESPDTNMSKDIGGHEKKISGLKPIKHNLSSTAQNLKKSGGDEERVHSSMEVDDTTPNANHLTSSPGNRNSSEQQDDKLGVSANTGGLNMNQTQTSHSIA